MVSVPIPTPPPIAVKPTKLACLRRAEGHKDGSVLTHTLIVSLCVGRGSCRTAPPIPRILWRAWWSTPPLRLRSASRCTNGVCLFILYHYCLRLHLARCAGQDVLPPFLVVVCRDGRPQSGGVFIGERLFILYQYFRFVHIMSSAPPGYAQGYAVGRHYHAVLRGRIVAEDDGTEGLVHSSTITNLWLLLIDVLQRLAPNTPTWWLPKWVSIHSP